MQLRLALLILAPLSGCGDCGSLPLPDAPATPIGRGSVFSSIKLQSGEEVLGGGVLWFVSAIDGCTVVLTSGRGDVEIDWSDVATVVGRDGGTQPALNEDADGDSR